MKIYIQCKSALLQRSLEMFLREYLSTYKQSDMVLRDFIKADESKPQYRISADADADIIKPFTRSYLLRFLEKKYTELGLSDTLRDMIEEEIIIDEMIETKTPNFDLLEKRIELLSLEYQKNILNVIKAFYEK